MRMGSVLRGLVAVLRAGRSTALVGLFLLGAAVAARGQSLEAPSPLLEAKHPVDWWFVFKLNSKAFPSCAGAAVRSCPFGGEVQDYTFGQQFVYASSEDPNLRMGAGCVGDTRTDPLGATFDELYNASYFYVIWNDQFYGDPPMTGCGNSCSGPWGHSKGAVAWDASGNGFALQVTTPSWPASGSRSTPRKGDGNTLGCVEDDNVLVSQHFFSVKLNKSDLIEVLKALANASVVTDPTNRQIVNNGGPPDVQELVKQLGRKVRGTTVMRVQLSTGIGLLSKPSGLNVPPWQLVSAELGGVSLRTATWWATPFINSTTASTQVTCWDESLGNPGAVTIATSGSWNGTSFGLKGGSGPNFNHAKIGVSTDGEHHFAIFGDMNQQGALSGDKCNRSQNGRGGLFYIIDNEALNESVGNLIKGDIGPLEGAKR